ncbi:MAG TPA: FtsX-like permease family protein [Pirellulales bacterium]|nr:FtsX-like permease family protein [Pirellulales bacterium]
MTDVLGLPVVAMWQQKSRTALTTLGVVFGSFVLAASLSIHQGVQETIEREAHRSDVLRRINVQSNWSRPASTVPAKNVVVEGKMSEARRTRIRRALANYQNSLGGDKPAALLTPETLRKLAQLKHVESVEPDVSQNGFVVFDGRDLPIHIESARPRDVAYAKRLVAGGFFEGPAEQAAVVHEFLLYRLGVIDEDAVESVLGRTIRIEIRRAQYGPGVRVYLIKPDGTVPSLEETGALAKINARLPALLEKLDLPAEEIELLRRAAEDAPPPAAEEYELELAIVGVIRAASEFEEKERRWWESLGGSDGSIVLPYQTAADLFFRTPSQRERGASSAVLFVNREENVEQVFKQVTDLGLSGQSALEIIKRERLMWLLVFGGMTCIAAVALMVAALGIANTMLMSVLERTREIGVMKAVGAADAHVLTIFLVEGVLIGLAGGALGVLLAWVASFPGDAWVRSMVSRDMKIELRETVFLFPPWLALTVVLFSVVVTTLATVYPARRAAKTDPVAALRHE